MNERNGRIVLETARIGAEPVGQDLQDIGIDFHAGHVTLAEYQRRQNVPAAAHSDDQNRCWIPQIMSERRNVIFEVIERAKIPHKRVRGRR